MDTMSSQQKTRESHARREDNLLKKGIEMMFNPEEEAEEYIKRKGKPMSLRTELCGLIFSGIVIIIIIVISFVYTIKNPSPASRSFFFFSVFILVFIWFLTFNYHVRKKRRVAVLTHLKHNPQSLNGKCPYCNNTFQIPQQNKPFRVKCPKCGKTSLSR